MSDTTKISLNDREKATILAALRYWQTLPEHEIPTEILDIADNGGTVVMMTDDEVDGLCERINCGDPEFEEVDLAEVAEKAKPKEGEYLITYEVTEEVSYSRSFKVDGAVLVGEAELDEMVEEDWVENGDANKDSVSVDERDYEGVWVTDHSGKRLSARVFFNSRL
jgi:hypothetical protein